MWVTDSVSPSLNSFPPLPFALRGELSRCPTTQGPSSGEAGRDGDKSRHDITCLAQGGQHVRGIAQPGSSPEWVEAHKLRKGLRFC